MVDNDTQMRLAQEPVKLNFVVPEDLASDLEVYQKYTGRTTSDLVRQLIAELLEGDIVRPPAHPHPTGPRTTVEVPQRVLAALEQFTSSNRHPTKAALLAALMRRFLEGRVERMTTVSVGPISLPGPLYDKIVTTDGPGNIEALILRRLENSFKTVEEPTKEPA